MVPGLGDLRVRQRSLDLGNRHGHVMNAAGIPAKVCDVFSFFEIKIMILFLFSAMLWSSLCKNVSGHCIFSLCEQWMQFITVKTISNNCPLLFSY